MRFPLVIALLLLLIQPLQSDTSIGPAENSTDSTLNDLPLEELNARLKLKVDALKVTEGKLEENREELRKKEEEVKTLKEYYAANKTNWKKLEEIANEKNKLVTDATDKLVGAGIELQAAKTKVTKSEDEVKAANKESEEIGRLLVDSRKVVTDIKDRQTLYDLAKAKFATLPKQTKSITELTSDMLTKEREKEIAIGVPELAETARIAYEKAVAAVEAYNEYDKLKNELPDLEAAALKITADLIEPNAEVAKLEARETNNKQRVSKAKIVKEGADSTLSEKQKTYDDAKGILERTPLDKEATLDAQRAEAKMKSAEAKVGPAETKVVDLRKAVGDLEKQYKNENNEVAALKEMLKTEEQKQRGNPSTGEFPLWIIAVVVVLLVVVGGIVGGIIIWKRKQKEPTTNTGKPLPPPDPEDLNIPIPKSRIDPSELSAHDKAIYDEHAVEGTEVFKVYYAATPNCKSPKTEIHFKCKCGLIRKIEENGNSRCELDVDHLLFEGPGELRKEHPPDHRNIFEDVDGGAKHPIHDPVKIKKDGHVVAVFGKDIEHVREMGEKTGGAARLGAGRGDEKNESKKKSGSKNKNKKNTTWMKKEKEESSPEVPSSHKSEPSEKSGGVTNVTATQANQCVAGQDMTNVPIPDPSGGATTTTKGNAQGPHNMPGPAIDIEENHRQFDLKIDQYLSEISKYQFLGNRYPLQFKFVMDILERVIPILKNEPQLMKISHPCVLVGDLHGQYDILHRMFSLFANGNRPGWTQIRYVFMGDYVDRGDQSMEVMLFLFLLKIKSPKSFALCRGNHESDAINRQYGFYQEIVDRFHDKKTKNDEVIYAKFQEVFSYMSHACLVSDKILCMHGGISPQLETLDKLNEIPKPLAKQEENQLAWNTAWGDPLNGATEFGHRQQRGCDFGLPQVEEALTRLNILMIARGHQMMMNGSFFCFGHNLVTIFTCSYEQTKRVNTIGAVMVIDENGEISFKLMFKGINKKGEKVAPGNDDKSRFFREWNKNIREYESNYNLAEKAKGNKPVMPCNDNDVTEAGLAPVEPAASAAPTPRPSVTPLHPSPAPSPAPLPVAV